MTPLTIDKDICCQSSLKKQLISISFLYVLVLIDCWSQPVSLSFKKFSGMENGLPEAPVVDILQDRQGYIWIAQHGWGLARYDGYEFRTFLPSWNDSLHNQLQSPSVDKLLEDSQGRIWIQHLWARGGLSCFDPQTESFTFYEAQADDPFSLQFSDHVILLKEDQNHNIWLATEGPNWIYEHALERLDTKTGRFYHYPLHPSCKTIAYPIFLIDQQGEIWSTDDKNGLLKYDVISDSFRIALSYDAFAPNSLMSNEIFGISEDSRGIIWIRTKDGLDAFDPQTNSITHYCHDESGMGCGFGLVQFEDQNGDLWINKRGGVARYSHQIQAFQFFRFGQPPLSHQGFSERNILVPQLNYKNGIWFNISGEGKGQYYFDHQTQAFTYYDPDFNNPQNKISGNSEVMMNDNTGLMWIGFDKDGLRKEDPGSQRIAYYQADPDHPGSLSNNHILSLFEDSFHTLWIGTKNGLSRFDPVRNQFDVFLSGLKNQDSQPQNEIQCIYEDRDSLLWIGTGNGLFRFHRNTQQFSQYLQNESFLNSVHQIYEDRSGRMWLSLWGKGIAVFDKRSGQIRHSFSNNPQDSTSLSGNQVSVIFEDSRGLIWFGIKGSLINLASGLNRYVPTSRSFIRYPNNPKDPTSFCSSQVSSIWEDSQKRLWISTNMDGLFKYDYPNDAFSRFYHPTFFWKIGIGKEDGQGRLWFGTLNEGLFQVDPQKGPVKAFGKNEGIISNSTAKFVADEQGNFWLPANQGLSRFDPENYITKNFYQKDGFQAYSNLWNYVLLRSSEGDIWIGGEYGLNRVHPEKLMEVDTTLPKVWITGLNIYDQNYVAADSKLLDQHISHTKSLKLKYNQNDLTFQFVGLHYFRPEDNQYSWILENYDLNWSTPSKERKAHYTNLSPGTYFFKVKASNADGVWNTTGASLQIIIMPPIWARWWAYSIYVLSISSLIYFWYKHQLTRKLEKAEVIRLKELDEVKTKLYTNVSHEFRTPLTVISGMSTKILENPGKWSVKGASLIHKNSKYLIQLVNQILDLRKLESGHMEVHYIQADIINYLKFLTESFHAIAEDKNIHLHFLSPEKQLHMDFDPEKIQYILVNLLSNAIKYNIEGGDIYVSIYRTKNINERDADDDNLLVKIKDTGIGIPPANLAHIFDRFYQVDDSTTRKTTGTGIGLAFTKELVQLLKGDIRVTSEPGKGSEFTLLLPITNKAKINESYHEFISGSNQKIEATESDFYESNPTAEKHLLLIVEDNPDVRKYILACIEEEYSIVEATNGKEGIDKAIELLPDIIISDVMMPEKNGYELCRTLKQNPCTSHIPIILLTAKADINSKLTGIEVGADAYLPKPFNPKELNIWLKKLIELRRQLQNHYSQNISKIKVSGNLEEQFLSSLNEIIKNNLSDENFGIQSLCKAICMSRTQLHRKIKALTNKSTSIYIRSIRLAKARELLKNKDLNISEIAYEVGFTNPVYFTQVFSEEFGVPPSEMR